MKIIIVGAGKVGLHIARDLENEGYDVILIEQNQVLLNRLMADIDVSGINGNGADYDVLMEADCSDCDVFIAVTNRDEINVISAVFARKLGAKHVIARVRAPEYAHHARFLRESLEIQMVVNPELAAAEQIAALLKYPTAIQVEVFGSGQIKLVATKIRENSSLVGRSLIEVSNDFKETLLVGLVERDGKTTIPDGSFILQAGDTVYVTGRDKDMEVFYRKCGSYKKSARSLLIVGGGRISYYLIRALKNTAIDVKVIEVNHDEARKLAEVFPDVTVVWGDGSDQDLLKSEGLDGFNAVAALTGIDEENILMSLFAKQIGVPKVITKINRTTLLEIVGQDALESIITPKSIIADQILGEVRSLTSDGDAYLEKLYRVGDEVEVAQFHIDNACHMMGVPLKELPLKKETLILFIRRKGQIIFPNGDDVIKVNDEVGVLMKTVHLNRFDDIFIGGEAR